MAVSKKAQWAAIGAASLLGAGAAYGYYRPYFSKHAETAREAGYDVRAFVPVAELQTKAESKAALSNGDLDRLEASLKDPNEFIRARVVYAIGRPNSPELHERSLALLEKSLADTSDTVRGVVMKGLARIDKERGKEIVARSPHVKGEYTVRMAQKYGLLAK
jgi:HEAT repeat protein